MRKRWLETLHTMAMKNDRIAFVGSDLSADSAFKKLHADIGHRFFMEGISEAYLVGMAAGLAASGMIPYVSTIATFLTRRCFEQVSVDVGLSNANVRLIGGGGGLVYTPLGPTHLAIDDIALMRAVPNMTVVVPADADEMERVMLATEAHEGPVYIRVAKGGETVVSKSDHGFQLGKAIPHRPSGEILLLATGVLVKTALAVADSLAEEGMRVGVLNVHTIKPLDSATILEFAARARVVLTMEEHLLHGGLGSAVAELVAENHLPALRCFKRLGLPDQFPKEYGSQDSLLAAAGLSPNAVAQQVRDLVRSF
jgi:transketolase